MSPPGNSQNHPMIPVTLQMRVGIWALRHITGHGASVSPAVKWGESVWIEGTQGRNQEAGIPLQDTMTDPEQRVRGLKAPSCPHIYKQKHADEWGKFIWWTVWFKWNLSVPRRFISGVSLSAICLLYTPVSSYQLCWLRCPLNLPFPSPPKRKGHAHF